ncbi:MAG: YlbF family regulator [Desulfosporosinus sp.]
MINYEIKEKAELLAEAITQSSERAELLRTQEAMGADESAQQLIAEFQVAYDCYMEDQKSGGLADKTEVIQIQSRMDGKPSIAAYMTAQDNFREMLDIVNTILTNAIAGSSGDCSCQDGTCDPGGCETSGCGNSGYCCS